ncbi:hypothetical protein QFZ54_003999 [Sphingomonas faeni]|nr:hypothetical protein [Sphingomonas faeni]
MMEHLYLTRTFPSVTNSVIYHTKLAAALGIIVNICISPEYQQETDGA